MEHGTRDMVASDQDEVVRIIRLHDTDDGKEALQFFDAYFGDPARVSSPLHRHIVYVEPGERRVVGVSGHGPGPIQGQGIFWLGWTYVNPYFTRRGIGGSLLSEVVSRLRLLGGRKLYLDTSSLSKYEPAIKLYTRFGFREEGRFLDYYQEGEDCVIMARRL